MKISVLGANGRIGQRITLEALGTSRRAGRRTGKYRLDTDHLLTNDEGESFISMEDYAFALLDEIEQPRFIRQRFTAVSLKK